MAAQVLAHHPSTIASLHLAPLLLPMTQQSRTLADSAAFVYHRPPSPVIIAMHVEHQATVGTPFGLLKAA